jgi:hypothetical protein
MSELEMKKLEIDILETMANIKKMGAETATLSAETLKLSAETSRISKQTLWYPFTLGIAFVAAIGTIVKLLF